MLNKEWTVKQAIESNSGRIKVLFIVIFWKEKNNSCQNSRWDGQHSKRSPCTYKTRGLPLYQHAGSMTSTWLASMGLLPIEELLFCYSQELHFIVTGHRSIPHNEGDLYLLPITKHFSSPLSSLHRSGSTGGYTVLPEARFKDFSLNCHTKLATWFGT